MALLVVRLTMGAAVVAAVIFLVVARRAAERRQFGGLSLVLTAVAGMLASMVAVLPSALWIARVDLQRTPAALLLLAPLTAALAGAVSWIERPRATVWTTVGMALLALVPGSLLAVGAGAVGGAKRMEQACEGNLEALAGAFKQYRDQKGCWPNPIQWVDELAPSLPHPKAYRCPAMQAQAYLYRRPEPSDPLWEPVIACPHRFLGICVVLRKDLRTEVCSLTERKERRILR